MTLDEIELELEKLLLLDKQLIAKNDLYIRKLDKSKLSKKVKDKALFKFWDDYSNIRILVGKKRLFYYGEKQKIIGKPKSIKVNTSNLDFMLED